MTTAATAGGAPATSTLSTPPSFTGPFFLVSQYALQQQQGRWRRQLLLQSEARAGSRRGGGEAPERFSALAVHGAPPAGSGSSSTSEGSSSSSGSGSSGAVWNLTTASDGWYQLVLQVRYWVTWVWYWATWGVVLGYLGVVLGYLGLA